MHNFKCYCINEKKEICLSVKEYANDHICEGANMPTKCNIFVTVI